MRISAPLAKPADLNILNDKKNNQIKNPFSRTVKEWPKFDPNNLINLSNKIDNRVELMIDIILMNNDSIKVTTKHSKTDGIIDKKYNNGFFRKIGNRFGNAFKNIVVNLGKGSIKTKITKETIRWILEDLEDKNLLK